MPQFTAVIAVEINADCKGQAASVIEELLDTLNSERRGPVGNADITLFELDDLLAV